MTEKVYRPIRDRLFAEALDAVSPAPGAATRGAATRDLWRSAIDEKATSDVPENLIRELKEHLAEGYTGCDHSVNICECATRELLKELVLWLDHKETCPGCHGDGSVFNEEKHRQAVQALPPQDYDADSEYLGYEPCPLCNGQTWVVIA